MNNQKHFAAAISAFVIWGFISIPLRALKNFPAGEILYFRILFSALTLLIIIFVFRRKTLSENWQLFSAHSRRDKKVTILLTLAGGALLCVNWLTFIYIVNSINIKTASFSYLICPVFTAVLGYFLLQEKITILQWIAVGLCTLSCVLIGLSSALELGYSFLTAITYALYLISQRKNQGYDRILVLGVQIMFAFLLLNVAYTYLIGTIPESGKFYSIIVVIAVLFTVLPLFLNLFALNKITSSTIGILLYINPILNFALAFLLFNEQVSLLQAVGYTIIIMALILFNYPNLRKIQTVVAARTIRAKS